MAVQFNVPASPAKQVYQMEQFLGADFTSDESTVDATKSPSVINMIRSVPGKVRKRMGYKTVETYDGQIYGAHYYATLDAWIIHAGTKLYNFSGPKGKFWSDKNGKIVTDQDARGIIFLTGNTEDQLLYEGMAEHRSVSFQLDQKLVILDGSNITIFDGFEVKKATDAAYVPTFSVSNNPSGGSADTSGLAGEAINMLSPYFIEQFIVDSTTASATQFHLSFGDLDATEVKAWILDSNGEWIQKTEGTDFSVDRANGIVTFATAPGVTPAIGSDNVKIQAAKTFEGYANRINHCTIGALFGVNGANDRLFVSGNSDNGVNSDGEYYSFVNYDWYSEQFDPTYFPDTGYSKLGSDSSAIMGYSIINNYLATHKNYNEDKQSIMLREGDLVDGEPAFKLINTLQGAGALSKYCFSYLETEPLFLTKLGIYAVTAQDVTGEKYAQNRSYYLDGKLLEEENLENAFAYTFRDFYILCVNSKCYILDGLQPMRTDRSMPYATRQYASFYFENVPATAMWSVDKVLYFGTAEGKVCEFYSEPDSILSYSDDGEPIPCTWETAFIDGDLFYKNKNFRYLALRVTPAASSSVRMFAEKYGVWSLIKEDFSKLRYFSFSNIIFSKFTFSCDTTQKVISTKVRLKKLDKVRFRFMNDRLYESFGLNNIALEYTQGGNHK